ncbi:hypothetical protein SAM19_03085 [Brevibacillus laterosporus]|nr:hypothetical protein [Brevibacillus laterosporus]
MIFIHYPAVVGGGVSKVKKFLLHFTTFAFLLTVLAPSTIVAAAEVKDSSRGIIVYVSDPDW